MSEGRSFPAGIDDIIRAPRFTVWEDGSYVGAPDVVYRGKKLDMYETSAG
jgi:hypothetical protein